MDTKSKAERTDRASAPSAITPGTPCAVHPLTGERVAIDPQQRWFWTPRWLAKEVEVEQALQNGEYQDFDTMDDFLASL
jgi:hypothetical protein